MDDSRHFWLSYVKFLKKNAVQWLVLLLLAWFILNGFMPKRSHQETLPANDSVSNGWQFASPREFVPAKVYQSIGNPALVPENTESKTQPMESPSGK